MKSFRCIKNLSIYYENLKIHSSKVKVSESITLNDVVGLATTDKVENYIHRIAGESINR